MQIPCTPITAWAIPGLLKNSYRRTIIQKTDPVEQIINIICSYFNLTKNQLIAKNRFKQIVYARHIAFYLIHKKTNLSQKAIAHYFLLDRTTYLYGIRLVEGQLTMKDFNCYKSDVKNLNNII